MPLSASRACQRLVIWIGRTQLVSDSACSDCRNRAVPRGRSGIRGGSPAGIRTALNAGRG